LEVLYNWCNLNAAERPSNVNYRERWGLAERVVFLYGGNIGVAQDIDNILRLAARVRDEPRIHFLLVGEGSEVPRLQRELQARHLTNVTWRPPFAQHEYLSMLSEFDVGLISLDRKLKTQNFPGKMLGYMTAGLPVLASINAGNDLQQLLKDHAAGLVYENGDDDGLLEGALRLARSPELRRSLAQNGRALLARHFSVESAATQITRHVRAEQRQVKQAA
jgi:glycosyltransferase involved in cell wall biosynthesis